MTEVADQLAAAFAPDYRILRRLGEGGMATVYLADDVKHDRQVALKVLRPELTAVLGAERFVAEIKTTARLQHPLIVPLFGSGQVTAGDQSFLYYVMPFIDGETLRQKLDREQALGVDDAVRIARAIATALDYAHRHDVIHRDIKPENVMLIEGQVLVADFGIALAVSQAGGRRITETGLSVGTPPYMSPEQAAADRTLDARTDIYSLGAVTYEMLVGRCPFEAASVPALVSKILTAPATRVREERPAVPRNVDAAVHMALSKLPADRFASAAQLADALAEGSFAIPGEVEAAGAPATASAWRRYAGAALLAVLASVITWLAGRHDSAASPPVRVQAEFPELNHLAVSGSRSYPFDISADGRRLVYVGEADEGTQLFVRDVGSFEWRRLAGTSGATQPFFSPDGAWIGFFARDSLHRVEFAGGAPVGIAAVGGLPFGGAWRADGHILFAGDSGLYSIAPTDPTPVRLLANVADHEPSNVAQRHPRWPHFLPDGRHALVSIDSGTVAIDLSSRQVKWIFAGQQSRYLPDGYLIFHAGDEHVRVVRFDLDRLDVTGAQTSVIDNVFRAPGMGAAFFAVASQTGTLAYVPGTFNRTLVMVDRYGRETPIPAEPRGYRFPALSPDGRHLAVTVDPRPSDQWVVDIQRGSTERLQTPESDGWGVWAPDGKRLAMLGGARRGLELRSYPFAADQVVNLGVRERELYPRIWTSGGELLVNRRGSDILAVSVRDGSIRKVLATPASETSPALSPNGRWLAFVSDATGRMEIYVTSFPTSGERFAISTDGGADPVWALDGSELYYRRGRAIMAVPVRTGGRFEMQGESAKLFAGPYDFIQDHNWTVAPGGRFVMIKGDPAMTARLQLVLNWFGELNAGRDRAR